MEVVVVGSCNTDLTAYTPRLPKAGETIAGTSFDKGFGGKGANQAVMAAKMGARTAMVAKVGDDLFGRDYLENLKDAGVDCSHVGQTSEAPTGVAQICVDVKGHNFIVIVGGANDQLSPEDVDAAADVIRGAKVLVCQLEVRQETSLQALRLAREAGVTTVFNPAPATEGLDQEFYSVSDVVCPNETELELLTGADTSTREGVEKGARELISRGARDVVVTMGEQGALWVRRGQDQPAAQHFPAPKVESVVDTVGAGDALLGSLASYLARGVQLAEAIPRACEVASLSIQKQGAQSSFPSSGALPEHLRLPTA